jgi:ribosome-associated toxin RatA of RatAB toxin-antitoxin module
MTTVHGARAGVVRSAAGVLLGLLAVSGCLVAAAWPAVATSLSEDDRRRLGAGDVIVRDAMPPGASSSARGGTALALVRASPEQVWQVLTDYPGHARYYPRVTAAEVVESDERQVLVRYQVGIGPFSFGFHMTKYPDPARRRIEWRLADGHSHGLFRENSGYWQVDPSERSSLVTYAIAVRTLMPSFVTGGAERDSLVQTITALRKLVEQAGGAGASPAATAPGR